jgi:hypothetical protein
MVTGIVDPAGHESLGPLCREGSGMKLAATGTYSLIVNSDNGGPGTYHFVLQGASLNK